MYKFIDYYKLTPVNYIKNKLNLYKPVQTFESQLELGLNSSNFNIQSNIDDPNEAREGLDDEAVDEIKQLMNDNNIS